MTAYTAQLTITVRAGNTETALELARNAGRSLQGREGVEHCDLRLFAPVDVMRGQVALETER